MEIEQVPIKKIKVENRFRKDKGDLSELALSIKNKGLIQPITIDQHKRLISGERRLLACIDLGMDEIPCVVRMSNTKMDKLEVELHENIRRKDMHWSEVAALEKRIFEMKSDKEKDWTYDKHADYQGISKTEVSTRLKLAEALETMPELAESPTEIDAHKAYNSLLEGTLKRELTRRALAPEGEIADQQVNRIRESYKTGDALKEMKRVRNASYDFAEVDPPYATRLEGHKNVGGQREAMSDYNEVEPGAYPEFLRTLCYQLYRVLREDTYAIIWYGFEWHALLRETLEKVGFKVTPIPALWLKGTTGQSSQPDITLAPCFEQFFVARKGKPKLGQAGRGNVFDFKPVPAGQKLHPTEKPIELMKEIIDTFCIAPGSHIVCPFLGSGVTLLAAYEDGYTCEGWELSSTFKDKFEERLVEWVNSRKPKEVQADRVEQLKREVESDENSPE